MGDQDHWRGLDENGLSVGIQCKFCRHADGPLPQLLGVSSVHNAMPDWCCVLHRNGSFWVWRSVRQNVRKDSDCLDHDSRSCCSDELSHCQALGTTDRNELNTRDDYHCGVLLL